MKKSIIIALFLCALVGNLAYSQYLQGYVNGTLGPGTYTVTGSITLLSSDSLYIMPGTDFILMGSFDFDVYGYLHAVGTEQDSIRFYKNQTSPSWNGIDFLPTSNSNSILEYCSISNSNCVGVDIDGCSPTISHCKISNCSAGGG